MPERPRPFAPGLPADAGQYMTRSLRSHRALRREIAQQPGQPDQVMVGVADHQDVRVAVMSSGRP